MCAVTAFECIHRAAGVNFLSDRMKHQQQLPAGVVTAAQTGWTCPYEMMS